MMKSFMFENSALYTVVELAKKNVIPLRNAVNLTQMLFSSPFNIMNDTLIDKTFSANLEMFERVLKDYPKPEFGIDKVVIDDHEFKISQETVLSKTFCNLIHFRKLHYHEHLPKLLIVAPLSGHHATLVRGTVADTLPYFDVYVTDWVDARLIPLSEGEFDLHDFTNYIMEFILGIGHHLSIMAVCQPTVPVLAAVALLEEEGNSNIDNMILIGGPIDARESSTQVTRFAENRPMNWFEAQVITRVPMNYPGFMRPVYPGFIQLFGFMSMNLQRHIGEHMKLYQHLVVGDDDSVEYHKKFYDEYLSVLDLPAEFYLQTIKEVFKDFALPKGELMINDRLVKPEKITHAALLVLEGELDDISGVGQTKAAINICRNIPKEKVHYHLQEAVGHYGIFSGSKFRNKIVPIIRDFCYSHTLNSMKNNVSSGKEIEKKSATVKDNLEKKVTKKAPSIKNSSAKDVKKTNAKTEKKAETKKKK